MSIKALLERRNTFNERAYFLKGAINNYNHYGYIQTDGYRLTHAEYPQVCEAALIAMESTMEECNSKVKELDELIATLDKIAEGLSK